MEENRAAVTAAAGQGFRAGGREKERMHMKRSSGILLPVTALSGPYGIGTLGRAAYGLVDFLAAAWTSS